MTSVLVLSNALAISINSFQSLAVFATLVSFLAWTIQNIGESPLAITTILRSAASAAVLQTALLLCVPKTFTIGEATFFAQCIVILKYLWTTVQWSVLDRLGYALLISTIIGSVCNYAIGMVNPLLSNIVTLLFTIIGCLYATLKVFDSDLSVICSK